MARVLLVGYDPETVDFSDPALPPGMNAEKIRAGLALAVQQITDRGWEGDLCLIRPDHSAARTVQHHLAARDYACVVIGAGVRLPPRKPLVVRGSRECSPQGRAEGRHCLQYDARR